MMILNQSYTFLQYPTDKGVGKGMEKFLECLCVCDCLHLKLELGSRRALTLGFCWSSTLTALIFSADRVVLLLPELHLLTLRLYSN